jgi:hypothetical protein
MSIEQAIHRCWSTCALLCELVPAQRLSTGQAAAESAWPYVTLERSAVSSGQYTSSRTRVETVPLRFNVWDQRLDRAQQVASRIVAKFDRSDFDGADERVLDMRLAGTSQQQGADGVWQLGVDFATRLAATASLVR